MATNATIALPRQNIPALEDPFECGLVLRIDHPGNPSTRFTDRIPIRGWFVSPFRSDPPDLTIGIEEITTPPSELRRRSEAVMREVPWAPRNGLPYLENLTLTEIDEDGPLDSVVRTYLKQKNSRRPRAIAGMLNVSALIPRNGEPTRRFLLSIVGRRADEVTFSNRVEFALPPRSEWTKPLGGFYFPLVHSVGADVLAVQGWALRLGDSIHSVHLSYGEVQIGECETGIWSPELYNALPDPEESMTGIFAACLRRDDPLLSDEDFHVPRALSAKCVFQSGEELTFSTPEFHWRAEGDLVPCGRVVVGDVEQIAIRDGRLLLSGWVVARGCTTPRLFLQGTRKSVPLEHAPELGNSVVFYDRPDVDAQFVTYAGSSPLGFTVSVNPNILGRAPGYLRLTAAGEDGVRVPLGSRATWDQITRCATNFAPFPEREKRFAQHVLCTAGRLLTLKEPGSRSQISDTRELSPGVPLKLLFVSHNLRLTEGAPRVLEQLLRHVRHTAPHAEIRVVSPEEGRLRNELESFGVKVDVIPDLHLAHHQPWESYNRHLKEFVRFVQDFKPDGIVANTVDAFWGADAAFRLGIPHVWIIHESITPLRLLPQADPRVRMMFFSRLRSARQLVFVADATAKLFRSFAAGVDTAVIPNGVDVEAVDNRVASIDRNAVRRRFGLFGEETVVTIVGTTCHRKGQDVFVREAALLKQLRPGHRFRFFIVGAREIPFLEELRRDIERFGLAADVDLIPETPDVAPFYVASDVLVVASREESAPLVSLEAFAYQRPLVSTTVFGLAEQIRDGQNALAFDIRSEGSLARQIIRLLDDRELRERIVSNARRDVEERFALRRSAARHWEQILKAAAPVGDR